MKVSLVFNLPEESSNLDLALGADEMAVIITEIKMRIRNALKYGNPSEETTKELEAISEIIRGFRCHDIF